MTLDEQIEHALFPVQARERQRNNEMRGTFEPPYSVTRYSGDIAAAFKVVDAMLARGWRFEIALGLPIPIAAFWKDQSSAPKGEAVIHDSVPEAICRAALTALQQP